MLTPRSRTSMCSGLHRVVQKVAPGWTGGAWFLMGVLTEPQARGQSRRLENSRLAGLRGG